MRINRRSVIVATIVGTTAGCTSLYDTRSGIVRAAVGMDEDPLAEIRNETGTPEEIIVWFGSPDRGEAPLDVSWEDLEEPAYSIQAAFDVGKPDDFTEVHTVEYELNARGGTDGHWSIDEAWDVDVFEETDLKPDDFTVDEPGEEDEFELAVRVTVELYGEDGQVVGDAQETETGTIIVENTADPDDDDDPAADPEVTVDWPVYVEAS